MYSILAMIAARRYLSARPGELCAAEPISILKPVSGLDPGLAANLKTFFDQDYPAFEILFAVRDADDPAVAVIEKLQREHPGTPSRLLITGASPYSNPKVYSLERMLQEASHELIVMSDADTRVAPDFLRTIAAEFQDPDLGLATCPYRAFPAPGLWSRLEATGMNTDFISGILVARMMEGMRFAIGPTVAARRHALDAIGGIRALKDYLAEDFMMGKLVSEAGFSVILSSFVIEHHIGGSDWRESAAHRLRWVRSTRRSRPWGYIGQLFTMPLPLALLVCAAFPEWWPAAGAAVAIRFASAWIISTRILHARSSWLLLPLEDVLAFAFWLAGFFGNTVEWRGREYRIQRDGRFELATDHPASFEPREADAPR
jgi:ceramide glucosyltransferase